MELHVRELFAGRWMEGQTLDVEESIENGRSVGIVQVDTHLTLGELRREIIRQIEEGGVPSHFSFVERLGKQLVEIWEEEEPTLRVKDLVGKEPEILIVEHTTETAENNGEPRRVAGKSGKKNRREKRREKSKSRAQDIEQEEEKEQRQQQEGTMDNRVEDELYSGEERRLSRRKQTKDKGGRMGKIPVRSIYDLDRDRDMDPLRRARNRRLSKSLERHRSVEEQQVSEETTSENSDLLDEEDREKVQRNRPKTVRIRKEERVTEEVDYGGKYGKPKIKSSILKRSESLEDLRGRVSSPEGFLTADSAAMDDYFLERKPFSISEFDLRDLGRRDTYRGRKQWEPSKIERRMSGLFGRIRNIQDKTQLLKNIGQEHWRGRFFQLRRNVAPLEERVKELENEEGELQENLIRLFELRKPLRVGLYGEARKNNYILEAQKLRDDIDQLNTQLENIDLDLLKYRKMRNLTEEQIANLTRDIHREKFLRHLLIGRTLVS